jgi:transcription attenuation protein (tryptophan RNA-binding attenuator protein)
MAELRESGLMVIRALEDGITIIGLTRGEETTIHHTEKLNRGEVWICQFTEHISAVKVRGKAEIHTELGRIMPQA